MPNTERIWKKIVQDPTGIYEIQFEAAPRSTALVVIDLQKYMCCPDIGIGPVYAKQTPEVGKYWFSRISKVVVPNVKRLLEFFRSNRLRVIYVCVGPLLPDASDMFARRRMRDKKRIEAAHIDHFFYPGTLEHEVVDEIKPLKGEIVFNKNSTSAFNSTNIDQILRNMGIESLVITGMATHACVEITARDAADRGYNCILVDDACADRSQELHDWTMINFARDYGKVMNTKEVIDYLKLRL